MKYRVFLINFLTTILSLTGKLSTEITEKPRTRYQADGAEYNIGFVRVLRASSLVYQLSPTGALASEPETPRNFSRINIPLKTWIARRLPEYGKGPCPTGCKHMRLAHNPANGRIYFLGGDYAGPGAMNSARNELYSYSITNDNWSAEYPYCGPAGKLQPNHPDEVGWVWDTKRNVFWVLPGFMWENHRNACTNGARLVTNVLQFNPVVREWKQVPEINATPHGSGKFAVYDPITDSILSLRYDGGMGSLVEILDLKTGKWTTVQLDWDPINKKVISNARLSQEYLAADVERRHIYAIDPLSRGLFRYDIDKRFITRIKEIPGEALTGQDFTIPVWDSVNKVLLWPQLANLDGHITLYVYHPNTNSWERDPMRQAEGLSVRGNSAVFDPAQNALLLIGGLKEGDLDPTLRHFFLYRYGNALE